MDRHAKRRPLVLCFFLLTMLYLILVLHSRYSFCQSDESFYSSLVHRLWLGEDLIFDEWHPTQFYAPLLLPFYALYKLLLPSGEGVLLFFRILFITLAYLTSLALFFNCARDYPCRPSLIGASVYLLYSRANISGFSYYNLCLTLCILGTLCCLHGIRNRRPASSWRSSLPYVFSACFFFGAGLCNPYFMIAALCTLILLSIFRRTNRIASIMAGVMILCGMAYIWRFIRLESLPALMENISSILHDPEHVASYSRKLADLLNTVYSLHLHQYLMLAACVFVLVCLKPSAFADCAAFWSLYFFASCAYCLWFVSNKIHTTACYVILVILVLSTLPLVPLFWRSRRPKLPLYFYGGGLVLAAVFFLASNTLLDAMTVGFCFSSIGGILMLSAFHPQATRPLKHAKTASRLLSFAASLLIAMMVVFSAAHRFIGIYRDAPLSQLNTELHVGPAKGLITTPENARQYESIYQTITTLSAQYPDVRALHSKRAPWAYLCADWRYGTPTSWTMDISSAHLQKYHALYPDKRPSLIFLYSPDVGAFSSAPFNNHIWDPSFNQNNLTGALYDQIKQTGCVVAESEFVTVYHLDPIRQ